MKPHLKLLALLPDIDCFLAVQSLFPWELPYNPERDSGSRYSTIPADGDDTARHLVAQLEGGEETIVSASTGGATAFTATTSLIRDPHLSALLAAMGLSPAVNGTEVRYTASPAPTEKNVEIGEALSDRLCTLDAAWCLLRRIRHFETDHNRLAEAAVQVLQFANAWSANRAAAMEHEDPDCKRFLMETSELEARAEALPREVPGLESLRLNYDPRGSIVDLAFKGFHSMSFCAARFDWPVAKTIAQELALANRKKKFGKYEVRPTRISADVQSVLNGLLIHGHEVKIVEKLAKKLYSKVDETLNTIGGEWNTARQAHVFDFDPAQVINQLIETGEVYTRKDYEFFETQPSQVDRVIASARIQPGMKILEPSAGRGAIAMAAAEVVGKENVTCFELMPENAAFLRELGFDVSHPCDFLEVPSEPIFDRVVANPPFSGGKDVAHIMHAMTFLKPGGVLVAIASTQWQTHDTAPAKAFQAYLKRHRAQVQQIEAGAFKAVGTMVETTLLVIEKPAAVEPAPAPSKPSRNLAMGDQLSFLL